MDLFTLDQLLLLIKATFIAHKGALKKLTGPVVNTNGSIFGSNHNHIFNIFHVTHLYLCGDTGVNVIYISKKHFPLSPVYFRENEMHNEIRYCYIICHIML